MSEISIGATLWTTDHGRPDVGKERNWISEVIGGETAKSWLVYETPGRSTKINKKTMLESVPNYGTRRWYTARQKEEVLWIAANRADISRQVMACKSIATLRRILEILIEEDGKCSPES